ncbi:MAG: GSCFA domain-containing protein [Bacteroidales bacterium]|nr:GSCFA domain-containing protein [Bacteroidales bacterium]
MEFRTKVQKLPAKEKISFSSHVIFIGSCFAEDIGRQFLNGKMKVLINPFGVLYNPMSAARALEIIMSGKLFRREELYFYENKYLSFYHDTSFSSRNYERSLEKINNSISEAHNFLKSATHLFITFGTAWVYRWKDNNEVVANCHKIPATRFNRQLLKTEDIVNLWTRIVSGLRVFNNRLNIVFTTSPVRHMKDGAHGNQVSKSTLVVAIEELISGDVNLSYFPSYEIMLDELRDYRFYDKDLVHLSDTAIEYIWEGFRETYFSADTSAIYDRVSKITEATRHIVTSDEKEDIIKFRNSMLERIRKIKNEHPFIDLDAEEKYFNNLTGK